MHGLLTLLFSGDVQDRSKAEILHQNLPSWVKGHCLNHCSSQKLGVLRVRFQNHMSTLSKIWESVVPWNHLIPSADETTARSAGATTWFWWFALPYPIHRIAQMIAGKFLCFWWSVQISGIVFWILTQTFL